MKITFWGVRGSIVCGGTDMPRYGGNTTCIAVTLEDGSTVILDAGSGLRSLGATLAEGSGPKKCTILLSHSHWDHIAGLPFFQMLYDPAWDITIAGPDNIGGIGMSAMLRRLFDPTFFPISWASLPRQPRCIGLKPGVVMQLAGLDVLPVAANHGVGALGYRLESSDCALFYSGDHELGMAEMPLDTPFFQAMRDADVAIVDAQYTKADYAAKVGWGHSAIEQWPPLAQELGVGRLVLHHFDPSYKDTMLDDVTEALANAFPPPSPAILLAHEGLELVCQRSKEAPPSSTPLRERCHNCQASDDLMNLTDTSQILDSLLSKARSLTNADAGTLYLVEEDKLVFSYSQNETLFTASQWARQQYLNASLPVDATSIAGFVACNNVTLNLHDVRDLPQDVPYRFNESFDNATGYRTVSMCVIPLCSPDGRLVGVMQLINSKQGNTVQPFTRHMQMRAERLCRTGAKAIERGLMVRDMILRMLQTAALRDPTETGGHVLRVGAMVAELYHRWAENHSVPFDELREVKAQLRLASMLHDVGKVGISDLILKKPGKLEPDERLEMEKHAGLGARLFSEPRFEMDALAREIALHHHQKWNGTGYTGDPNIPPLQGEAIPLGARLTAIADVFDALVSPRCYKEPWPVERAVSVLEKDAGTHFDPECVNAFVEILDTMVAIRDKYKE